MTHKPPHNTKRSVSRQEKIEQCLQQNMLKTPYERIGLADMCRQMGISRQLFYTYFPDKEACLLSLIDRLIQDSLVSFPSVLGTIYSLTEMTIEYLTFWKEHSDFLDVIVKQNMKGLVIDRYFLYFKNQGDLFLDNLSTPEVKADDSILWLYAAVRFTVLMQWHENGYDISVEEMAAKYLRLLKEPILRSDLFGR